MIPKMQPERRARAKPHHFFLSKQLGFLGGGFKEHTLEDVFSNLEDEMKEEAKEVFLDSVERGFPVKNCISEVHEKVRFRKQIKVDSIIVRSVKGPGECADGAKGSAFREVPLLHQAVG